MDGGVGRLRRHVHRLVSHLFRTKVTLVFSAAGGRRSRRRRWPRGGSMARGNARRRSLAEHKVRSDQVRRAMHAAQHKLLNARLLRRDDGRRGTRPHAQLLLGRIAELFDVRDVPFADSWSEVVWHGRVILEESEAPVLLRLNPPGHYRSALDRVRGRRVDAKARGGLPTDNLMIGIRV